MVIGNHDIDEGNARLAEFAKQIDFPLFAGNMDLSQEDPTNPVVCAVCLISWIMITSKTREIPA